MGHDQANQQQIPRWIRQSTILAAAGLAVFTLPIFAQPGMGHGSAGHMTGARPMGSGHAVGTGRSIGPSRAMGSTITSGQRMGAVRANPFGAGFPATATRGVRNNATPHWVFGPNNFPMETNGVHGNHFSRHRAGFGVGFLGFPYYPDSLGFVDADNEDDTGDNTAQQLQPNAPGPQDYAPQAPYGEGPPEDGYGAPRAPYAPQGYPPPPPQSNAQSAAQSAAAQSDGLDHPALTLVFNDGRQPVKVHSYVLTGSSVFVAENGHQRVIPVADLDLPATIAQNRDAGVDFELPGGSSR